MERKLSAILAADVVGYSALMEKDEIGTFDRLKAHRNDIFEPEVNKHRGRVFKLMGDGVLAEFASAIDAVECAVALQRSLAARNASVADNHRIEVRIGINLGDVIVEGDDRYGEGVNVAARLQQLAKPGGICISGKVAKEVDKKVAFGFEPMGEHRVKNLTEPLSVFRVAMDGKSSQESHSRKHFSTFGRSRLIAAIVAVLIVMIGAGGTWYGFRYPVPQPVATSAIPSIAVLPFVNMSGDAAQDYLGPGVAEDIITILASFPTIRVVSRTSSFIYDKPVKVQQVAKDLGVAYVLEGSVMKIGSKVRITAQLINAATGDHIWANRYQEDGSDVVVLQENVANEIYTSLAGLKGEIRKQEEQQAWHKSAPSLDEYDYYLRGHQLFMSGTAEGNAQARKIWQEGLSKFPDSAILRLKLAWTYEQDLSSGRSDNPSRDLEVAWKLAKEAEADQDKSRLEVWLCHWLMAILYEWHDQDFARSVAEAEAAIALVPNDPMSRADLGQALATAGKATEAIAWLGAAIREDSTPPDWYFRNLGWAYYVAGRPEDAIVATRNHQPWPPVVAAAYVRLNKIKEAHDLIDKFLKENPGYSIADEAYWPLGKSGKQPTMKEPFLTAYLDDLRRAGLPDK